MSIDDKKINVEDITFDDMLGEGIEDTDESSDDIINEQDNEINDETTSGDTVLAESSLDADANAKEKEEENQEEDSEEESIESSKKSKTKKSKPIRERQEDSASTDDRTGEVGSTSEDEAVDDTVVGQILNKLGYEVDDQYDDTTEGLLALTKDVGAQMAEEQLEEIFNNHPLIKDHLDFVANGGDSQDFMAMHDPRSDFSRMKMGKNDHRTQKYVLSQYFKSKGHDDKFISELIEDYEDSGKLLSKAETAKSALAQIQVQNRQQLLKEQKQQRLEAQKQQKEFWNGVYDAIDKSTEFKGISVSEREKSKFFDYLSKPVTKEGYTQRDLDHANSEMDVKLAIDYLMYKGFNLEKVINKKARTKSTQSLKDRIKTHQETIKSAKKAKRSSTTVDIDNLNLDLF